MIHIILSIFLLFVSSSKTIVAQQYIETGLETGLVPEFVLAKKSEGITVFTNVNAEKGFVEYKAHTKLDETDVINLLRFFHDSSIHPKWIFNCTHSKINAIEGKAYLYQICHSPWPFKDRDLSVLTTTEWVDKNKVLVHLSARPNALPRKDKLIRIEDFDSTWTLEKEADKTKVTVWARFNPQLPTGNLFLRSYATKIPFETLKKLRLRYNSKKL